MTTIIPGWKVPLCPIANCPNCGEPIKPVAVMDMDEWSMGGFDCENHCNAVDEYCDHDWPFLENSATREEMEEAGFITV